MRNRRPGFVPPAWMFVGVSFGRGRALRRRIESITAGRSPRRGWSLLGLLLVLAVGCAALTDKREQQPLASAGEQTAGEPVAPPAESPSTKPKLSKLAERTRERLTKPIALKFDGVRLDNVLEYLREATGVPIVPNWRGLEAAGIAPGTRVTINIPSIPGEAALRRVLEQVGGDETPLGYQVDEFGVVVVAPVEILSRNTVIDSYDIRDLLVVPPKFEEPDLDRDRRDAPPPDPRPTREVLTLQIKDLIRNTVDPKNWREAGGKIGSINELNGTLIINTTKANHASIAQLLGQIRATRAVQVSIVGRFLLVDPPLYEAKVRPLLGELGDEKPPQFVVSDEEALRVIDAVRADADSIVLCAPRLTMFNGQRAYITVGTESAYVSDYQRDAKTGELKPVSVTRFEGVMLLAEATVSADLNAVTVSAGPEVRKVTDVLERPDPDSPPDKPLMIQNPQLELVSLRTTASVSNGKVLLLSWAMVEGNPLDKKSKDRSKRHLVVLIDPSIVNAEDAKAERIFPGVPQKVELFR